MKTNKKELLEIVLIFVLGVIGLLIMTLNTREYNKRFTNTQNQIESFSNDL